MSSTKRPAEAPAAPAAPAAPEAGKKRKKRKKRKKLLGGSSARVTIGTEIVKEFYDPGYPKERVDKEIAIWNLAHPEYPAYYQKGGSGFQESGFHQMRMKPFCGSNAVTMNKLDKLEVENYDLRRIKDEMERLHSLGIYHGDLSPNNLLKIEGGEFKAVDFGRSVRFIIGNAKFNKIDSINALCGEDFNNKGTVGGFKLYLRPARFSKKEDAEKLTDEELKEELKKEDKINLLFLCLGVKFPGKREGIGGDFPAYCRLSKKNLFHPYTQIEIQKVCEILGYEYSDFSEFVSAKTEEVASATATATAIAIATVTATETKKFSDLNIWDLLYFASTKKPNTKYSDEIMNAAQNAINVAEEKGFEFCNSDGEVLGGGKDLGTQGNSHNRTVFFRDKSGAQTEDSNPYGSTMRKGVDDVRGSLSVIYKVHWSENANANASVRVETQNPEFEKPSLLEGPS